MTDSPFKEEPIDENILHGEPTPKAKEELATLAITSEKYKAFVIDGVSVPSTVRIDCPDEPFLVTEHRSVEELTEDEKKWLEANINFIVDESGDFIQLNSGNQYAFYQTLLRIQYFIYVHNIPLEYFRGDDKTSRYYKLWNIGYLIESGKCDTAYVPEYNICVEMNMSSEVNDRNHGINKFAGYTYNLFKHSTKVVSYKVDKTTGVAMIKVNGRLVFDTMTDFQEWLSETVMDAAKGDVYNNIFSLFPKLNALYFNCVRKTTDTFKFLANPKGWIAQHRMEKGPKAAFNIVIYPEFIGDINLTTYMANVKEIEVGLEVLSRKIKDTCDSFVYKKA